MLLSRSWRDPSWRAGVQFTNKEHARTQLTARLRTLQTYVAQLQVADLLPDSVFYPRQTRVRVPWPPSETEPTPHARISHGSHVRPNPLAVLLRTDQLPKAAADEDDSISGELSDGGWEEVKEDHSGQSAHDSSSSASNACHPGNVENLIHSDEEGEEEEEEKAGGCAFVLHISFGNEDLQSQVRVEFAVCI